MKKLLLLPAIALSAIAFSQIPTTGLTDHWKLNGNLRNDIAARPALRHEGFHTCQNSSGTNTAVVRHADTLNFVADRSGNLNAAYHARTKSSPDSVFCNQVPPNGIWIYGPAATSLETTSGYNYQNTARTFALWAKINTLTSTHRLFFTGETVDKKAFGLDVKPATNKVSLFTWGVGNDVDATVNNIDTLWHHYAATYDGAQLKLYIDGAIVDSNAVSGLSTSYELIFFGKHVYSRNLFLDEILLYNRALSAAEVAQIFGGTQSSIADLNQDGFALNLYPNPALNVLTIESSELIAKVTVSDLTGRTVVNQPKVESTQLQMDVSQLHQSTYFIRFTTTTGKTITKTFVKQ